MSTPSGEPSAQPPACPLCGGTAFTWGQLGGGYGMKFVPDDASWLDASAVYGGQDVRARVCETCGNLQLFAESAR